LVSPLFSLTGRDVPSFFLLFRFQNPPLLLDWSPFYGRLFFFPCTGSFPRGAPPGFSLWGGGPEAPPLLFPSPRRTFLFLLETGRVASFNLAFFFFEAGQAFFFLLFSAMKNGAFSPAPIEGRSPLFFLLFLFQVKTFLRDQKRTLSFFGSV